MLLTSIQVTIQMKNRLKTKKIRVYFIGIILAISIAHPVIANPTPSQNQSSTQFRKIEQPLAIKLAVTAAGLGLIGLELWWFIFSQPQVRKAKLNQDN